MELESLKFSFHFWIILQSTSDYFLLLLGLLRGKKNPPSLFVCLKFALQRKMPFLFLFRFCECVKESFTFSWRERDILKMQFAYKYWKVLWTFSSKRNKKQNSWNPVLPFNRKSKNSNSSNQLLVPFNPSIRSPL